MKDYLRQVYIVDFGSQYTQLIARKARELGYSSKVITLEETIEYLKKKEYPKAIILSGGPHSILEDDNDYSFLFENEKLPILGICYGMQLIGNYFEGEVEEGVTGEYGSAVISFENNFKIDGLSSSQKVWMSHADHIRKVPDGFSMIMESKDKIIAGIKHNSRPIMGLQFHPEVAHSENGKCILEYFFSTISNLKRDWSNNIILSEAFDDIKAVGDAKVLCAFSGGVDSLVAAIIAKREIGDNLYCFFVDNGLNRPQDINHIKLLQEKTGLNIEVIDAKNKFYEQLADRSDPEIKRKIIGKTFIDVFEDKVHEYERDHRINFKYLLQGTLYTDIIESKSPHKKGGKSVTIKSHHNVGGLPERMKLKLVEPLSRIFKDEVRSIGKELSIPRKWLFRHPFPGPGLGVRILGVIDESRVKLLGAADQILFEELINFNLYDEVWQSAAILLPVKTVGVKGDSRVYEEVIALRIVDSSDGMTASVSPLSWEFFNKVSSRIANEVSGITRVVYDITSKPPSTIEWE